MMWRRVCYVMRRHECGRLESVEYSAHVCRRTGVCPCTTEARKGERLRSLLFHVSLDGERVSGLNSFERENGKARVWSGGSGERNSPHRGRIIAAA
ncbi:hypothetical protein EVAR_47473_1 [Eumeta japonica]|uniref:Uncharacterized protein n=1 Tax=Eumeta variegata TaxID=151549 RepID=A0A4C1XEW9_EUMVA|nr:hypothetical protein EVAR_47473_1 [Eumeta japonica]